MDAAAASISTMMTKYEIDWTIVLVAVASFALVYVALNLSAPPGVATARKAGVIRVSSSIFNGRDKEGDFHHEIENCPHLSNRTLYIFNDNAQDHPTSLPGGGNAIIRPFNKYNAQQPTKSAGISTGAQPASRTAGGFDALTPSIQRRIDAEIDEIRVLLASGEYDCLKYSADRSNPAEFGTGTFVVDADVKRYIVNALKSFHMKTPASLAKIGTGAAGMSLSSTLQGRMTPNDDGGRPARRQSFLRSPRKSIAAMTGMSGFFSGKRKGRSSPRKGSAPEHHSPSPPSPFDSAAAARGDNSLVPKPSVTPTTPVSAWPGPATDRHSAHELGGLWDMVEVQEMEAFMVARGVS